MNTKRSLGLGAGLGLVLFLNACSYTTQSTSGEAYLQRYAQQAKAAGVAAAMDPEIRVSADVEPLLTFPARVGVARIENGRLSAMPQAEGEAWAALAERLGPKWGSFVPVSPLIAALAGTSQTSPSDARSRCDHRGDCFEAVEATVRKIRLGAARQHVDAVLIYEVVGKSTSRSNPLAIANIALLPMFFMPSENVEADGHAQAVLLDVRNGYTYGFASAVTEDAAFTLSSLMGSSDARESVTDEAQTAAALELVGEVETMARELRLDLAEKRLKQLQPAVQ